MLEDPETAWRWSRPPRYVLRRGDRVFVSISASVDVSYCGIAHRAIVQAGFEPLVFHNSTKPPAGLTTNFFLEALADFYRCPMFLLILSKSSELQAANSWALDGIRSARRRGVAVRLHVIQDSADGSDKEALCPEWSTVVGSIRTARSATAGEFTENLSLQLRELCE